MRRWGGGHSEALTRRFVAMLTEAPHAAFLGVQHRQVVPRPGTHRGQRDHHLKLPSCTKPLSAFALPSEPITRSGDTGQQPLAFVILPFHRSSGARGTPSTPRSEWPRELGMKMMMDAPSGDVAPSTVGACWFSGNPWDLGVTSV